jgi:hypothetical protein
MRTLCMDVVVPGQFLNVLGSLSVVPGLVNVSGECGAEAAMKSRSVRA